MKKIVTTSMLMLLVAAGAIAQPKKNVHLFPESGTVCNPMEISLHVHGNGFNPVSYLWSTGETTPTIQITQSGTYTLTVTGYHGNSGNMVTKVRTETYNVLPAPDISALTDLWVCKNDTVRLQAVPGYDFYTWSNGASGMNFERKMEGPFLNMGPVLDTLSVSYTATVDKVCSVTSEPVLLRAIRRPEGVGVFYENKMNIRHNDSIPASLVLEYLYPVTYEMSFTEIANPSNTIKYVTAPGSRRAPASMLTPGASYHVETTPIINGVRYCPGPVSTIGIRPSSNRLGVGGFEEQHEMSSYRIYDMSGKLLMEKQSEEFNREWLNDIAPQMVIIHRNGTTSEVIKMQVTK